MWRLLERFRMWRDRRAEAKLLAGAEALGQLRAIITDHGQGVEGQAEALRALDELEPELLDKCVSHGVAGKALDKIGRKGAGHGA